MAPASTGAWSPVWRPRRGGRSSRVLRRAEGRPGPGSGGGARADLGVVVQDSESGDYDGLDADIGVVTHQDLLRFNMRLPAVHGRRAEHRLPRRAVLPAADQRPRARRPRSRRWRSPTASRTSGGIWDMSRIWAGSWPPARAPTSRRSTTAASRTRRGSSHVDPGVGLQPVPGAVLRTAAGQEPGADGAQGDPRAGAAGLGYTIVRSGRDGRARRLRRAGGDPLIPRGGSRPGCAWACARASRSRPSRAWWPRLHRAAHVPAW